MAPPGFGVFTCFQAEPSQCTIRVLSAVPLKAEPTAHALLAEVERTPNRKVPCEPGFGLVTCFQAEPFQCRIMDLSTPV